MPDWLSQYKESVRALRKSLPPEYPVLVRRDLPPNADAYGTCSFNYEAERFIIRIVRTLRGRMLLEILVHEWAHAMAWHVPEPQHGPCWGVCYSQCYRLIFPEDPE